MHVQEGEDLYSILYNCGNLHLQGELISSGLIHLGRVHLHFCSVDVSIYVSDLS